ncbi:MAG: insulinase family protein [Planctomycetes bacterium]|nr:insulinase family protein [Planctomycetota bacterium]
MSPRSRSLLKQSLCAPLVCAVAALSACASEPRAPEVSTTADAAPVEVVPAASAAAPAVRRSLLPTSTDFTLPNGMRVLLVTDHEIPLVSFTLRCAGGSVEDPAGREGAASMLATLLTKGAGARDAKTFQEDVEFAGGTFGAAAGQKWTTVSCDFLKGDLDLAFELLGDVVMRPRLDPDEFEKERGLAVDGIAAERESPQSVIGHYATTWTFGRHPYGRSPGGDEASLAALTIDDVRAGAARQLSPKRAWLAVAGDIDPADMRRRIEARFGSWASSSGPAAPVPPWTGTDGGRVLLVDAPTSLQTYFRFGNLGFDWKDPDYAARWLANTILGGRFTSRLNRVLRTEKGLTYGANSFFDDDRNGLFVVATYTEVARSEECVTLAEQLYRKFIAEGMTQEELDSARTYSKGQFGPGVETGSQQAAMLLALDQEGVPRDVIAGLFEHFDSVTLDQINRVIKTRFPKKLDWVVVGPAATCRPFVTKLGKVTECKVSDPGWGPRE